MAHMNIINNFISTSCRLYSVVDCQLDCMCASCKSWSSRLECVCLCVCKCVCVPGGVWLLIAHHILESQKHISSNSGHALWLKQCPDTLQSQSHQAYQWTLTELLLLLFFFFKKKKLDQRSRSRCPPLRVRLHYNTVCVCVCMIHEAVKHQTYVNLQLHSTVCGQSTQGWLVKMSPLQVYSLMWRIWNV